MAGIDLRSSTSQSGASSTTAVKDWAASDAVAANEVRRLPNGSLGRWVGTAGTTGTTFNAASWAPVGSVHVPTIYGGGQVVSGRNATYHTPVLSDGTVTGMNSRILHKIVKPASVVRVLYHNGYNETDGPNTITVRASLEISGVFYPVFFGGQRSAVIEPGGARLSDPVSIGVTAAGTTLYSRTFVEARDATGTLIASGKWPTLLYPDQTGEGVSSSSGQTDKTMTGTITGSATRSYSPRAIVTASMATDEIPAPVILLAGDSIMSGASDSSIGGFGVRAVDGTYGWVQIGLYGERGAQFSQNASYHRRIFVPGCTSVICNYATNDEANGDSAATVKATITNLAAYFKRQGIRKVFWTTTTPRTDVANTTPIASEAVRVAVNDALRAGTISGIDGYFETADAVESSRNSGLWGASFVPTDGLHPTSAGHIAMAATIDLTKLV